jgi:hypothetical protein
VFLPGEGVIGLVIWPIDSRFLPILIRTFAIKVFSTDRQPLDIANHPMEMALNADLLQKPFRKLR